MYVSTGTLEVGEGTTHSRDESPDKRPTPHSHRLILLAPFSSIVTQHDLKGKVDEDRQCQIFLRKSSIQQFEVRDCVVCLKPNLRNQMNHNESLDVPQLQDSAHSLVDVPNTFFFFCEVFLLEHCEADSDENVHPAPECEVRVQGHEADVQRLSAEVFIGKVRGLES